MDGDDTTKYPQMRSRNFSVKSMFIGVVGRPRPDNNFDCYIVLEIISKTYTITKRKGKWMEMILPNIHKGDLVIFQ